MGLSGITVHRSVVRVNFVVPHRLHVGIYCLDHISLIFYSHNLSYIPRGSEHEARSILETLSLYKKFVLTLTDRSLNVEEINI